MNSGSIDHEKGNDANVNGIVCGHMYSLISVHELHHEGKPLRLMKLRNPWA
jgi:hypothetical protein